MIGLSDLVEAVIITPSTPILLVDVNNQFKGLSIKSLGTISIPNSLDRLHL